MKLEQEAKEFMNNRQEKTSDELTPEDKEAFRFYFELVYKQKGGVYSPEIVLGITEDYVKEEKKRLNVS